MNGFRIDIRVHCHCAAGGHDSAAYRTATDGLVVAPWVHRSDEDPTGCGRWTIVHLATGLILPCDYGDPESAMACAQALGAVGDWRSVDPTYDRTAACETLIDYGGEATGTSGGEREQLNEVPA